MTAKHRPTPAFALTLAILLIAACSGASSDDGGGTGGASAATLSCMPGEARACPCARPAGVTTMGTQTCDAGGRSFGVCSGCPAAQTSGAGGTAAMPGAGAGAAATAGSSGGASSSGAGGGAAGTAGGGPSLDQAGAVPGTSCGVGLPVLCARGTEKCCTRSLEADTCIPTADACACALPDCTVLEARCDGPEDCAGGEVCCGTLGNTGAYVEFVCATQCADQQNQRQACHDGETECPAQLICANSQLLTNVQVCIDPASIEQ